MSDATDTTINPNPKGNGAQVITITDIADNDPIGSGVARTTQQHIIPTAIQPKFVNTVQQWPQPALPNIVRATDLKQTATQTLSSTGNKVSVFNFLFASSNPQPIFVQWCGTLFIDGSSSINAYPEPGQTNGNIAPTDWVIESYEAAYFGNGLNGSFAINQLNQSSHFFTVKLTGTGTHQIFVQYYWRSVINTGGSATPVTLGQ